MLLEHDEYLSQQALLAVGNQWDLDNDSEAWFKLAQKAEAAGHHAIATDFLCTAVSLELERSRATP